MRLPSRGRLPGYRQGGVMKLTFGFRKSARHALPRKQGTRKFDNREAALWVAPLVAVGTIAFLLFTALRPSVANTLQHFNKPHNPYVGAVTPGRDHAAVMLATSPTPTNPSAPPSTGSEAPTPTPTPTPTPIDSGASPSEPIAPPSQRPVITTPSPPTLPTTPPTLPPTSPAPPPTSPAPPPTSPAPPPTSPAPPPTGGSPAPTSPNPTSAAPRMPAPTAGQTTASPTP